MKDESDSISNQSDQFLTNKNKSNTKASKLDNLSSNNNCASTNKLEPHTFTSTNFSSSSSLQSNDTDIPTTSSSFSTFKTQKRQFEKIKHEFTDEDNLDLCTNNSSGLTSTSSSNSITSNLNECELADNDNKHLIESESKRQRSDFNSIINSSNNASSSTLMELDSDNLDRRRENNEQETGETLTNNDETNLSNSKKPNLNQVVRAKSSIINDDDEDDDLILSHTEESLSNTKSSENMEFDLKTIDDSTSLSATTSKTTKTTKASKFKIDPNECHDWDRIHDTVYFKENSLNFNDIINREFGYGGRFGHGNRNNFGLNFSSKPKSKNERTVSNLQLQSSREMISKGVSSFNFVRRMKMSQNLNYHEGCVNALNFNRIGTLLASGSDDYQVCIWDWARSKVLLTFDSGHKSNVFQTKFMPFTRDSQIVTCARDGQVRLALISSSGSHIGTKKLAKHSDSCHKLSIEYDSSNMFLSCGEDAVVYEIDLRQQTPARILTVKNYNRNCKLPLYSISNNPFDTYQFAVAGKDPYIRYVFFSD